MANTKPTSSSSRVPLRLAEESMQKLSINPRAPNATTSNSSISNQAVVQNIHGNVTFYGSGTNQHLPSDEQSESGRRTIPFTTIATYAQRVSLSQELEAALEKPLAEAGLAHGATVFGLGGTGKTQLVLRYIETHKTLYDSVLWLDVQSQETARSSFERCCRQLSLPIDRRTRAHTLQDSGSVHTLLRWLSRRKEGQEWLVVIDNADDLTWSIHAIIPKGRIGTVIITSQDRAASTLLDRKCDIVHVDAMTNEESLTLLLNVIEFKHAAVGDDTRALLEATIELVDTLPLAVHVVGHRIRTGMKTQQGSGGSTGEASLRNALLECSNDIKLHGRKLFGDTGIAWTPSYQKTVWNVWETSLASLGRFQQYHPNQLLALMARLGKTVVPTVLFRDASFGLRTVCEHLKVQIPTWLGEILQLREDGTWDDFVYREAVNVLQRFGLVRPATGASPGVTIHRLVRGRAAEEANNIQEWRWFAAFAISICHRSLHLTRVANPTPPNILVHLPPTRDLARLTMACFSVDESIWAQNVIASLLQEEGKLEEYKTLRQAMMSVREQHAELRGHHKDSEPLGPPPSLMRVMEKFGSTTKKGDRSSSVNFVWDGTQFVPDSGLDLGGRPREAPQRNPSSGPDATTNGNALDFLRYDTGFRHMRRLVQQQPNMLEPVLNQMAADIPQLAKMITKYPEPFMQLLSEDADEDVALPPSSHQISVTCEERDAIARLCRLGFERDRVIQAYFQCDKNEERAVNFLFE